MANIISKAVDGLYQVWRGLVTVGGHTFKQPITKEFPDQNPNIAGAFRGRLALAVNPNTGDHLCISCLQCERVCPDKCIQITAHKSPETNKPELIDFKIDHGLCMFCGLCTEVCPTSCIINTNDFEMADYTRESLVYDLRKLTLTQEESGYYFEKKEIPLPKPKPVKPAAAAAGAKPAAAVAKPAAKPTEESAATGAVKPAATADAPKPAAATAEAAATAADAKPMAKPEATAKTEATAEKAEATAEAKSEVKADEAAQPKGNGEAKVVKIPAPKEKVEAKSAEAAKKVEAKPSDDLKPSDGLPAPKEGGAGDKDKEVK